MSETVHTIHVLERRKKRSWYQSTSAPRTGWYQLEPIRQKSAGSSQSTGAPLIKTKIKKKVAHSIFSASSPDVCQVIWWLRVVVCLQGPPIIKQILSSVGLTWLDKGWWRCIKIFVIYQSCFPEMKVWPLEVSPASIFWCQVKISGNSTFIQPDLMLRKMSSMASTVCFTIAE